MKVSIVIPIYNVENYIVKCLESCINQTYRDIEVICVNDGSPDNSGEIIEEYVKKDSRLLHLKKNNEGLCFARKSGVEIATGEYIFHLDGDDYLPPTAIDDLLSFALKDNLDIVKGNLDFVKEDSSLLSVFSFKSEGFLSMEEFISQMFLCKFWTLAGSLIKRSLYVNSIISYKEIVSGEDLISLLQLASYSSRLGFIDRNVYYYVKHDSSIMATRRVLPIEGRISFIKTIFDIQQGLKPRVSKDLYFILSEALVEAAVNLSRQYNIRSSKIEDVCRVLKTIMTKEFRCYLFNRNKELYFNYQMSQLSPLLLPTWMKVNYKLNSLLR
ncbi:MAG: glycosyltransferase family 2 protein [Bacteroidales bacterium]